MAIQIPTLNELYNDIKSQLESELNITIPLFGKSYLRVIAIVWATKLKLYYLAIGNVQKNIFVDTADPEAIGGTLERFGRIKLGRSPFPASAGVYDIQVTGTIGATIAANTTFKANDDSLAPGKLFILDTAYVLVSTTDTITVRALEVGIDSRLDIGNQLTSTAPIANVDSLATVLAENTQPLAAETIEDYRSKVIEAFRLEPQGGAGADYRLWSNDAQAVRRVYPYNKQGFPNEIEIYVEATIVDSIDSKGTPSTALLNDVEAVVEFDPDTTKPLNERGRRPLGVFNIDFNPITVREIDITITGFVNLTLDKQTAITNLIESRLYDVRPFVDSIDILADKNNQLSANSIIFMIQEAVQGASFGSVDMYVDGVLTPSIDFMLGDIPHLNSINFV